MTGRIRLLAASFVLALGSAWASQAGAVTLNEWRAEADQVRLLAENDLAAAEKAVARLQADLPEQAAATERARLLNLVARIQTYRGQTDEAEASAARAAAIARGSGDRVGQAESELVMCIVAVNQARMGRLVEAATQSVSLLEGAARPELLSEALLRLGTMYGRFGQLDDQVAFALQALELAQQQQQPQALAYAHQGMAIAFELTHRYEDAERHYAKMIEQGRLAGSRLSEAFGMLGVAGQQRRRKEFESSRQLTEQALALFKQVGSPFAYDFALYGLADQYREQGQYKRAADMLSRVLNNYATRPNLIGEWFALNARSSVYEAMGDKERALADAKTSYAVSRQIDFPMYRSGSARRLGEVMALEGNHRRAYELAIESADLTAQATRERSSVRIMQLLERYRDERRVREMAELGRRNERQAAELTQSQLQQRWLWTLTAAIAILLAVSLTFTLRLRRKRAEIRALANGLEQRVHERTEELERMRDAAEAATQAKSDFLATMSHEIRTPMNAILGMSWLALQSGLEPRQRGHIEKVHQAAEALLAIINDILDISKVEAGKLELECIPFKLAEVLEHFSSVVGLPAEEKGLDLVFDVAAQLPSPLLGDPSRLGQVLINLGGNAVKFTERGDVRLRVSEVQRSAGSTLLRFEVQDSGVGIPKERQAKLFQRFSQADESTSRRFGGTGLGLVICRRLVTLMGGEIGVESEAGKGSRFYFTARFGIPAQLDAPDPMAAELKGARVLIADDSASARDSLCAMAAAYGLRAEAVADGAQALQAVIRADAAGQPYKLLLLDWRMPGMDGVECVERLGASPLQNPAPTVLMVTAFRRQDVLRCLAEKRLQVSGVLTKPVLPAALHEACSQAMGSVSKATAGPAPADTALDEWRRVLGGRHVLLAEDNAVNQELACALLARCGVSVTLAANGQEALEQLETGRFDAVLMDCHMPVMDGYRATSAIRLHPEWRELPVIAMTANSMPGDRLREVECGMNDHVGKPVKVEELYATLARWLRPLPPQPAAAAQAQGGSNPGVLPHLQGLDASKGIVSAMGDEALFLRLLLRFREHERDFAQRFEAALLAGDGSTCRRYAHDLKSEAGSLGMPMLSLLAAELEAVCARGDGPQDMRLAFEVVLRELNPLLDGLAQVAPYTAR